ncbi:MAG: hypothetical protein ACKVQW_15250 [Pyrinomonadaceae bacterium]
MKNWNLCLLGMVLLLLCSGTSGAQPGWCYPGFGSSTFNPWRACNPSYISEEFVFVGRIISRDTKVTPLKDHGHGVLRTNIAVVTPIKGKLERTIELFLDRTCSGSSGNIEDGEERIFTARRAIESGFNGLVSDQWSTSLKDISKNDLTKIIKEIRSVLKGTKQPRIVGKLVQYDSRAIYSGSNTRSGFSGSHLMTKLGYDPNLGRPLVGIEITAVAVDWKLNPLNNRNPYKTNTKPDGGFQFKNLPVGYYVLSPKLPDSLDIFTFVYKSHPVGKILYERSFESVSGQYNHVKVGDGFCSEDVRFNVLPTGSNSDKEPPSEANSNIFLNAIHQ